ncbi:N-acetyl-gamma-glutamyl-phosphate reductase [Spirochaetia bacterium]|nr:N-acetyl-gamma-glutamyl-phosphate reductase [Spirochaetia bacterium]
MIAGVIGAAGYAGAETVRLLAGHPSVDSLVLGSVSSEGENIDSIYLNFLGRISCTLQKPAEVIARSDIVFAALPNGVGENYAKAAADSGKSYIDLSADFRFDDDEETYTAWYGKPYTHPELRRFSVYGLPELNRAKINSLAAAGPVIIGNPGCYPTGASLGIFPALAKQITVSGARIIVDAASGVTGGGREPSRSFHYPECADSVTPYKVGSHRHVPEISRNLANMASLSGGAAPPLIFTPHLVPMNRGILSTIYIPLAGAFQMSGAKESAAPKTPRPPSKDIDKTAQAIRDIYAEFYRDEPFVRVLPYGAIASTGRVRQSNYCDISLHIDQDASTLIVVSAIDNMVKGAAGQAIQNMNIILGLEETAGLTMVPALF